MRNWKRLAVRFALVIAIIAVAACSGGGGGGGQQAGGPQAVLADNTILVDDSSLTLVTTDGTTFTYSYTGTPTAINTGDILLSGEGEGYLRKVTSVLDNGGTLDVVTEQASLDEAFEELHIRETITMESNVRYLQFQDVLHRESIGAVGSVGVNLGGLSITGSGDYDFSINSGSFDFIPTMDVEIDISGGELKNFKAEVGGAASLDLNTTFTSTVAVDVTPPELSLIDYGGIIQPAPVPIFSVTIPVPTPVGIPIPVIITGKFTLSMGITFSASGAVSNTFDFTSTYNASAGVQYQNSVWNPISSFDYSFNPTMSIDNPTSLSAKVYIRPKVGVYLYGAAGPYFDLRPYGKGAVVIDADPNYEAGIGITGNAGGEVKILSWALASINIELFDLYYSLWESPLPECNDTLDNDGDTLLDWQNDLGCTDANDASEYGTNECDDGADNDGDTNIDYPADTDCSSLSGTSETGGGTPACNDGADNDGDTQTDFPNDPGCADANDASEYGTNECDDGADNDGDTFTDYPADTDCSSLSDTSETGGAAGGPMALIPSGCFNMGDAFGEGNADELPVHNVCITSDFYMDVHEVTNTEYQACVGAGGCTAPFNSTSYSRASYYGNATYDNFPVIYVNWNQATAYCTWASKRLPTEAEWEYAARGGLAGKRYPWGDSISCADACYGRYTNLCWNYGGLDNDTHAVESYAPNGYGLYGMAGNVWEWNNDWYSSTYYSVSPINDPPGASPGTSRVLRGGSWSDDTDNLHTSVRIRNYPDGRGSPSGFRCARTF